VAPTIEKNINSPKIKDFFIQDYNICIVIEHKKKTVSRLKAFPSLGRTLEDRYIIIKGIASGGFGVVYLVKDATLPDRYWALKEMHETLEEPGLLEKSFKEEAKILSKLDHPNIPTITHFFTSNNKLYLVMEYIAGETLKGKLQKMGSNEYFREEQIVDWALTLCDVLDYLHNFPEPIVFRDLKPDNIMVSNRGDLKLIDFGIARIFEGPRGKTTTHALLTQGYAPPEQWMGKAEPRSDIFSLGATLHHLITGVHPQKYAPNFIPPKNINPAISDELNNIVMRSLQLVITQRYQSIKEMKDDLEKLKSKGKVKEIMKKAGEYEKREDYMEAVFQYKKALEIYPCNEKTLFSLASCYETMGLEDEAKKHLRKISEITQENSLKEKAKELIERIESIKEIKKDTAVAIENKTSSMGLISVSSDYQKAGEPVQIAIKIPKNPTCSVMEERILITTTRPEEDTITQPVYTKGEDFLKGFLTSTRPGESIIKAVDKATGEIIGQKVKITFRSGFPDPEKSEIRVAGENMISADGQSRGIIEITLLDKFDNPAGGTPVKLYSHRGENTDSIEQPPLTDHRGKTRGEISSETPGTLMVTAVSEGMELKKKIEMEFIDEATKLHPPEEGEIQKEESRKDSKIKPVFIIIFIIAFLAGSHFINNYYRDKKHEEKLESHIKKGDNYFSGKNYEAALLEYENALELDPDIFQAHRNLGEIYLVKKDYERALAEYQKALALEPGNREIPLKLAYLFTEKKEFERALETLEKILKTDPKNSEALKNMALTCLSLKDYDRAFETVKKLSDTEEDKKEILNSLAKEYITGKNYDKAVECLNIILSQDSRDIYALKNMSSIYMEKKDYEKAIEKNKKILEISPENMESHINIALSCYEMENYEDVILWVKKATALKPDKENQTLLKDISYKSYVKIGEIYLSQNKYTEGEGNFNLAEKLKPGQDEVKTGLARCYLGQVEKLINDGNYEKADTLCKKVLSLFSEGDFRDRAEEYLAKIDELTAPIHTEPDYPPADPDVSPPDSGPPDVM